jgi:hypothetical protein
MGTDTIVSKSTILIIIRFLESEELKFEISIFVVLSMMAREQLKFLGSDLLLWNTVHETSFTPPTPPTPTPTH